MKIEELDTPALIVDLDIMERNITTLAAYCRRHGLQLRPHTKTHKIPAIARMQVEASSGGITVAKVGEAEVMADAGLDDILIAYPVIGKSKSERLASLAQRCQMTVAVDSLDALQGIAAAARQSQKKIGIVVEVDVGANRCGVHSRAEVVELARAASHNPNLDYRGIMFFMGLLAADPQKKASELEKINKKLDELSSALRKEGIESLVVSGGSTPSAYSSHQISGLTEIRSGTYVFNDMNTVRTGGCEMSQCALRVLTTVVSNAVPGRAALDAGSKTLSSDRLFTGDPGFGLIVEHPEIEIQGLSEEHGHLNLSKSDYKPTVGEKLTAIPNHVCVCVNLHDRIYYHRKGIVEGRWKVEGRGKVN